MIKFGSVSTARIISPREWWNPRRKRFWLVLLFLLYTLVGFLLGPWVIQNRLIPQVAGSLDRPIILENLHINPYVLSIEATGFRITEAYGRPLAGFDRLYVNFQLSSIFRFAWTFREITLERPAIAITRDGAGQFNLGRLLAEMTPTPQDTASPPTESELVRLIIRELDVLDGTIELTDFVPEPEVSTRLEPINIEVDELSTLPSASGQQKVVITTEPDGRLEWSGRLQLNPLLAEGQLSGAGRYLPIIYRYAEEQLTFEVSEGHAEYSFDYRIEQKDDDSLAARIDNFEFDLRGIILRSRDTSFEILTLPEIAFDGGTFRWPEQSIHMAALTIGGAQLNVLRGNDGLLNLQQLTVAAAEPATKEPAADTANDRLADWTLSLDQLAIEKLTVTFEDQSLTTAADRVAATIDVVVREISNALEARFPWN
jgi:uncharacterized protein involved in outer membrane biogenesis